MDAVTNIEQFKQCRFIILKCSRSEFRNGSHWAKVKGLAGLSPSKSREENSFLASSSFQRSLTFLDSGTLPLSSEPRMAEQVFLRLPSLCVLSQILPFVRTLMNTWSPPRYSKLSPYFKVRRLAMYLFLALTYSLFFLISLCIYRLCWVFAAVCRLLQLQRTGSLALCVGSAVVAHGFSCPVACGIFIPQPGIESMAPALEDKFLTTGPPGKS